MAADDIDVNPLLIVQARMGSTRLPGKAMIDVAGRPLLGHLLGRVSRAKRIGTLVVATTHLAEDDAIASFCDQNGYFVYRGSPDDVLGRFCAAAEIFNGDPIVRICGDCPLIDPAVIDQVVDAFCHSIPSCDYASNTLERTFPRGMDVEVIARRSFFAAANSASFPEEREHVTPYILRHPERFRSINVRHNVDLSHHRWTVDTPEDLELISLLLETLIRSKPIFTLKDLLLLVDSHPQWQQINAHIRQREI